MTRSEDQTSEELRLLALGLLDRAEPGLRALLARLLDQSPTPEHATCTWCPVCAVVGLLRGERPELAATLGEHAEGLLAALRAALDRPASEDARPNPPPVQRIEVRPAGGSGGGC